jgi:predicted phosphodiesterase
MLKRSIPYTPPFRIEGCFGQVDQDITGARSGRWRAICFGAGMRLGFFSDLHLAPGTANRCGLSTPDLLAFFERVDGSCDIVVVNGDLFDLSRPRFPGAWRDQFDEIRRDHPTVVQRLECFCWTYGNHDRALERLGVPEGRLFEIDGMSIFAIHGHQGDGGLKRVPGLEASANFVAGWCHRRGYPEVSSLLEGTSLRFAPVANLAAVVDAFFGSSPTTGYDLVVHGHDHKLGASVCGPTLFASSGSLTTPRGHWVQVDTADRSVTGFDGDRTEFKFVRRESSWMQVKA